MGFYSIRNRTSGPFCYADFELYEQTSIYLPFYAASEIYHTLEAISFVRFPFGLHDIFSLTFFLQKDALMGVKTQLSTSNRIISIEKYYYNRNKTSNYLRYLRIGPTNRILLIFDRINERNE